MIPFLFQSKLEHVELSMSYLRALVVIQRYMLGSALAFKVNQEEFICPDFYCTVEISNGVC